MQKSNDLNPRLPNPLDEGEPTIPKPTIPAGQPKPTVPKPSPTHPSPFPSGPPFHVAQPSPIQHIFVLMLENRSFDHMLGFSGISGTDAVTGKPTTINGLTGTESNTYNGRKFTVQRGADSMMPHDPAHEFPDVVTQLAGQDATYPGGGQYPKITSSGYVASYVRSGGGDNPEEVMKCYTPQQLPALIALAKEFVVCDNWYASLPGPTWPNRMFAHAASSNGLDHSPSNGEIVDWELFDGFEFPHGSIFDALNRAHLNYRIYAGDDFPMVSGLKGITIFDVRDFSDNFARDVRSAGFNAQYAFIEPSYDALNDYKDGTSQHPLGNVARGDALIRATYEAIRNSPIWDQSMLIITWDEHGGFYDHADSGQPPQCVAPGDTRPHSEFNQYGFTFEHFGPRVPAIIVSPLVPKNLIDHRIYDHSSIPATIERNFNFGALTQRDAKAKSVNTLATLSKARTDTPSTLPGWLSAIPLLNITTHVPVRAQPVARPTATVNEGNLPVILHAAMRQDLQISPPELRLAIIARVRAIQTRAQAFEYIQEVEQKVRPKRVVAAA